MQLIIKTLKTKGIFKKGTLVTGRKNTIKQRVEALKTDKLFLDNTIERCCKNTYAKLNIQYGEPINMFACKKCGAIHMQKPTEEPNNGKK